MNKLWMLALTLVVSASFAQGVKITALPAATTPVSGNEKTAVVQNGVTTQVDLNYVGQNSASYLTLNNNGYLFNGRQLIVGSGMSFTDTGPGGSFTLKANPGGVTFATPSALVGLTANAGVALTSTRSDATPALDQSISPTWTGSHIFSNVFTVAGVSVRDTSLFTSGTLGAARGGTGVSNSNTITLGGNIVTAGAFTTSGANSLTLTTTGPTNVTLPTSGTLSTTSGANPTALVGLSTVNGSATTFTRSDGAPALDQSITPTWTGIHTFSKVNGTGSPAILASSSDPRVVWRNTSAPADSKWYSSNVDSSGNWFLATENDANTLSRAIFQTTRSGVAVTGVNFGNVTDNPTYTFAGAGGISAGSSVNGLYNLQLTNSSTGTSAYQQITLVNSAHSFRQGITGTAFSGGTSSGSPTGEQIFFGSSDNIPISITTNNIERIRVGAAGDVTANSTLTVKGAINLFGGSSTALGSTIVLQGTSSPGLSWSNTSGSADNKNWDMYADTTGVLHGRIVNDAVNSSADWLTVTRSGMTVSTASVSANAVKFPSITTTASAANAFIDNAASNSLLRSTSSRRYKTDITPLDQGTSYGVLKLQPIRYHSKAVADDPTLWWYGLVAEDVAEIEPRLVAYDSQGRPDGVQYDRVGVLTLAVVKDQQREIHALFGCVIGLGAWCLWLTAVLIAKKE